MLGVGHHVGGDDRVQHAARARDLAHDGAAVSHGEGTVGGGNEVDCPRHGDHAAELGGKLAHDGGDLGEVLVGHGVVGVGVHAAGCGCGAGKGLDLAHVAANDGDGQLVDERGGRLGAHGGGAGANRIEHDGMAELPGDLARLVHGGNGPGVQRADVEHEAAADLRDGGGVVLVVRHDGGATAGEQRVGAVVDGDVVGDAVHERRRCADVLKCSAKHVLIHGEVLSFFLSFLLTY